MNVIPNNILNRSSGYSVKLGQLRVRVLAFGVKLADILCLLKRQFRLALQASSLFNHVLGIVFGGTKEDMGRVNAAPIIARMTKKHSLWNWTTHQFPCKSMRSMHSRIITAIFVSMKLAISRGSHGAVPVPTGTLFIDLLDKPLDSAFTFHRHAGSYAIGQHEGQGFLFYFRSSICL